MAKNDPGATTWIAILPMPKRGTLIRAKVEFGPNETPVILGYATDEKTCLAEYREFYKVAQSL